MARQIKIVTQSAVNSSISSALMGLPQYVNNGGFMTRAELKAAFPANVDQLGKLARVSDVYGSVRTSMICEYDGTRYYWRPQRTDYAIPMTQTSGAILLTPLVSAPSLIFKNTLTGNMTINPVTNGDEWPGCFFDIQAPGGLGLFSMSIGGLLGGLSTLLNGGARKRLIYTANGWEAS